MKTAIRNAFRTIMFVVAALMVTIFLMSFGFASLAAFNRDWAQATFWLVAAYWLKPVGKDA